MNDSTPPVPEPLEDQEPPSASAPAGLLAVVVEGLALMAADLVRSHLGRLLQPRPAGKSVEPKVSGVEVPKTEDSSDDSNMAGSQSDPSSHSHAGILVAVILAAVSAIIFWNHRKK